MFEESVSALPSIWASMNSWLTPTVLFLLLNLMIGTIAIASSLGTQKHHDQDQQQQHHPQAQHQGLVRSSSVLQRFKSINFYSYRSPEPASNYEKAPESETHFTSSHAQEAEQPQLHRSPSMLQRLQSIKFQFHFPRDLTPDHQQPREFVVPTPEPHFTTFGRSLEDASHEEEMDEEPFEHEEAGQELDEDHFEAELDEVSDQTIDEIYSQLHLHDHHVTRTSSDTMPASGAVPAKLPKKMKKSASTKSPFSHFAAEDIVESRRPATVKEKKTRAGDHEDDEEVDAKADDFINRFKQQLKLQRLDSIIRYKDMINRGSDKQ